MIEIADKANCCGCAACAQICPKSCITMQEDEEGFLYPYVNKATCVDCHLCEKTCPVLNVRPEKTRNQKGYVVQHKNKQILHESTSGGAFTAIAEWVIKRDGVVFGAAYDKNFVVKHTYVENIEDIIIFRNSKYAQSEIGDSYQKAKTFLDGNRLVLFSGTPCQLEGLLRFLRKTYDNLIAVDVVCRACPSPLVFKKYLEMVSDKVGKNYDTILFRDKYYGYQYSTMSVKKGGRYLYHEGIDTDSYLRSFFSGISVRPSCMKCVFRKRYRETDLTIWDCFNITMYDKQMDNDQGATKVLAHSLKGTGIMKDINSILRTKEVNPEQLLKMEGISEIDVTIVNHPLREAFFSDIHQMKAQDFFDKYFPVKMKNRMEKFFRILTFRLGLYSIIKKVYIVIIGRDNIKR